MVGLAVHHIQLAVKHGTVILAKLKQAGFQLFAQSSYSNVRQWAMRSGTARFVITETRNQEDNLQSDQITEENTGCTQHLPLLSPSFVCPRSACKNSISGDSVFNIAFEPFNIEKTLHVARGNGAHVLHDLRTIDDGDSGHVRYAVIKSCLGNVVHTLLDTSQYTGVFLPGFIVGTDLSSDSASLHVTHFDHITLACNEGQINEAMKWYEVCLGMKRFYINRNEDKEDGMVVKERSSGLRLKALEYWRCSEQGLSLTESSHTDPTKPAFVFAEAISGPGPNQIRTFLKEHGCEGIQHVGLYTPHICNAVRHMRSSGLTFITPPVEYYTEIAKQEEIKKINKCLKLLQELSVLVDVEEESHARDGESNEIRYLMQIFSKPIFSKDTFFLELIQREGSQGFGSGNIKALWRAVADHLAGLNEAS